MIKNVHGNTVDHLGEAIVAGHYPVGGSLPPEPALCEALGVSRTVVRESVKSLIAKGLISSGPKVGTRVLPQDQWNWFDPDVVAWQGKAGVSLEFVRDLQDLRRAVEPAAVRLAAERASAADIAEIAAAYDGMALAVEHGGDYITFDLRFHHGLMRASHNRMLIQMTRSLGALLSISFQISTTREDGPRSSLPLHRAVLDAVAAHRPDKAEKAILLLIENARDDIDLVLSSHKRLPRLDAVAPQLRPSRVDPAKAGARKPDLAPRKSDAGPALRNFVARKQSEARR
jgi:DNA-binding FadR family transcriptional regulator